MMLSSVPRSLNRPRRTQMSAGFRIRDQSDSFCEGSGLPILPILQINTALEQHCQPGRTAQKELETAWGNTTDSDRKGERRFASIGTVERTIQVTVNTHAQS